MSGSDDKKVIVWSVVNNKPEAVFELHTKSVTSLAVTSDSIHIISGSVDKTVRIWSLESKT